MAKTKEAEELSEPIIDEVSTGPSEIDSGDINIEKYFQLHEPAIDVYVKAYAEDRFRGIMKSKGSWKEAIRLLREGEA